MIYNTQNNYNCKDNNSIAMKLGCILYVISTKPETPKAQPNALADSVTVRAGVVAVRQWMAEGKG